MRRKQRIFSDEKRRIKMLKAITSIPAVRHSGTITSHNL